MNRGGADLTSTQPLADSSYLSVIGGVPVRIVEAQVSITCTGGAFGAPTVW